MGLKGLVLNNLNSKISLGYFISTWLFCVFLSSAGTCLPAGRAGGYYCHLNKAKLLNYIENYLKLYFGIQVERKK